MEDEQKRKLVLERLQNSVLNRFKAMNPSFPLNSEHSSIIHQKLDQMFHSFHTPTHPTYCWMIKRAISDMKEENGSTREAISEFIKKEFEDLPWAHARILDLHLRRLCLNGDLVFTDGGRYVFVDKGI